MKKKGRKKNGGTFQEQFTRRFISKRNKTLGHSTAVGKVATTLKISIGLAFFFHSNPLPHTEMPILPFRSS